MLTALWVRESGLRGARRSA